MPSSIASSLGSTQDSVERAGELAAQRICNLLEEGRNQTGLSRSTFFTQALRVWDALLRPIDLDEYLNTICVGIESAMPQITQAFHELQVEAIHHYMDVLGIVYMLAGVRANTGEEYTPWSMVQLLVRLQMDNFVPPAPGDPTHKVYDPCCGSGTLLLGHMEYLDFYYPEVLDRNQAQFFGQDASYDAWLMARINLRIHATGRYLRRGKTPPPHEAQRDQSAEPEPSTVISEISSPLAESPIPPLLAHPPVVDASTQGDAGPEPPDGLAPLFAQAIRSPAKRRKRKQIVQPTLPGFSSS
jgi:hypothetical protein